MYDRFDLFQCPSTMCIAANKLRHRPARYKTSGRFLQVVPVPLHLFYNTINSTDNNIEDTYCRSLEQLRTLRCCREIIMNLGMRKIRNNESSLQQERAAALPVHANRSTFFVLSQLIVLQQRATKLLITPRPLFSICTVGTYKLSQPKQNSFRLPGTLSGRKVASSRVQYKVQITRQI